MSIGIVGLGYVGLPLAWRSPRRACDVIGVDVDAQKVAGLRDGPLAHRGHRRRAAAARCSSAAASRTRFVELHEADAILDLRPDAADRATASPTSARC